MPRKDGTGPFGTGPGTGQGRGWCRSFLYPRGRFSSKRFSLIGTLVPVAGAILRDLVNPNGFIRTLGHRIASRKKTRLKKPVDADYIVLKENKPLERR